jgi:hypothetical protein
VELPIPASFELSEVPVRPVSMRRTLLWILLTASLLFSQANEIARIEWSGNRGTLIAEGPRPMAAAAAELALRFGMYLSVEDPAYLHVNDKVDVTEQVARRPIDHRIFIPRTRRLEVPFEAKEDGWPANRIRLVDDLIEAANTALPFGYQLEVSGMPFSIVPRKTRNKKGEIIEVTPLLDQKVSIPPGRRKVFVSAGMLAEALSAQAGLRVSCCQSFVGGVPWGIEKADFSADDEPARDVLRRLIKLTPGRYIWLLSCAPSPSLWCVINLRSVTTT